MTRHGTALALVLRRRPPTIRASFAAVPLYADVLPRDRVRRHADAGRPAEPSDGPADRHGALRTVAQRAARRFAPEVPTMTLQVGENGLMAFCATNVSSQPWSEPRPSTLHHAREGRPCTSPRPSASASPSSGWHRANWSTCRLRSSSIPPSWRIPDARHPQHHAVLYLLPGGRRSGQARDRAGRTAGIDGRQLSARQPTTSPSGRAMANNAHAKTHPYLYLVDPSPWPFFGSMAALSNT